MGRTTVSVMTSSERSSPERTCVGCRAHDARDALLRFVVRAEAPRLVPDLRRRLPGRGVSVHPTRDCIAKALGRGGFARALKGTPTMGLDELTTLLVDQYDRRLEGLLASALRARRIAIGTDAVEAALADGSASVLWVARDAAGRREDLIARADRAAVPRLARWTKEELGRRVGRAEVAVLAIQDRRIADEVVATVKRATDVSEAE